MKPSRLVAAVVLVGAVAALTVSSSAGRESRPASQISSFAKLFNTNPLLGGQVPPRLYMWANKDVSLFVQLDRPNPAEASALRYVGISVTGTFCAEAQPGGPKGGFTHYHRLTAPVYAQGHGGQAGENKGFWLL